jgi:membrane protease YdiL (CAAX protease family)
VTTFAAKLRGFGLIGIVAIVIILCSLLVAPPVGALLVLIWARVSRTPWRDLGFVRPKSVVATLALGVATGVALKFVMKAIVMPLLSADPVNHAYHYLVGNRAALPMTIIMILIGAGFSEELVCRGYFFERLRSGTRFPPATIVVITAVLFGAFHYSEQGMVGVVNATIVGLVFGTMYAFTRSIWMVMIAHAAFDLVTLATIYWDVEAEVAHLIFR